MSQQSVGNNFVIPSWAGKPASGLHLDVLKDGKLAQKLMIDEKKCYFFGRNKQLCDFAVDHASCSRVHAALLWHRHLIRPFIIDLGSTHGTFIGNIRLEAKKPQHVPIDSVIHFGASTRTYIIRERPQQPSNAITEDYEKAEGDELEGGLLGLPENESELDNLTEFNTAHNRRATHILDIADTPNPLKRKKLVHHVWFREEEEIINPEDIDPSIGRFRNLVSTTVIITKKQRMDPNTASTTESRQFTPYINHPNTTHTMPGGVTPSKVSLPVNLAPSVTPQTPQTFINPAPVIVSKPTTPEAEGPKKKVYAKEVWPGRKSLPTLLV